MAKKKGGLLFGIAVGTLMGVLFAPGKGKSLRNRIMREIDEGGLGTKALGGDIKMMGKDIADAAQDIYADPRLQRGVNGGKKNLKQLFGDLFKKIKRSVSSPKTDKK